VDVAALARQIFDSYSIGRVKLTGAILSAMELYYGDRFAILALDDDLLRRSGATIDDTEGLVNMPLAAREVRATALFKRQSDNTFRLSLRSKDDIDVRQVAVLWHGGGHKNAAGCTMTGTLEEAKAALLREMAGVLGKS
jgi:phosphoesterase RecJ-like protein